MSSTPGPVIRFLGRVALEATRLKPFLPTYLHLLVSAIFPIYTGAHASLSRPSSAAKPEKKQTKSKGTDSHDESDDEEDEVVVRKMEGLSPSDAIMFPLMAGMTLASLYLIINWLQDPATLNKILRYYFSHIGLFFSIKFLKDASSVFRSFTFPEQYTSGGKTWKVDKKERKFYLSDKNASAGQQQFRSSPLPGFLSCIPLPKQALSSLWSCRELLYAKSTLRLHIQSVVTLKTPLDILDILSTVIAISLGIYSVTAPNPWYLTNFFGFSFCYGSLQFMSPTTFWTGSLVLSSLFFYDIYFVFFTPLMVTVATKLDVPIKLLFPRPAASDAPADAISLAMLGLGDIVIPGMMIGLALRFDLYMFYLRQQKVISKEGENERTVQKAKYIPTTGKWGERCWSRSSKSSGDELAAKRFPKPYFSASVVGYLLGMMTTLGAMQITAHGQPALLYLVPGVLGSLWGTGFVRGEVKEMWSFTEEEEEQDDQKKDGEEPEEVEGILDTLRSALGFGAKKDPKSKGMDVRKDEKSGDKTDDSKSMVSTEGHVKESDKKTEKKSKDRARTLVAFSITLPKSSNSDSVDVAQETGQDQSSSAKENSTIAITSPQSDGDDVTAHTTSINTTPDDEEPPTKRTRMD